MSIYVFRKCWHVVPKTLNSTAWFLCYCSSIFMFMFVYVWLSASCQSGCISATDISRCVRSVSVCTHDYVRMNLYMCNSICNLISGCLSLASAPIVCGRKPIPFVKYGSKVIWLRKCNQGTICLPLSASQGRVAFHPTAGCLMVVLMFICILWVLCVVWFCGWECFCTSSRRRAMCCNMPFIWLYSLNEN